MGLLELGEELLEKVEDRCYAKIQVCKNGEC